MSAVWRSLIAIGVASGLGLAFYYTGYTLAYLVAGTDAIATYHPIILVTAILVFPLTAGMALATHYVLTKAFGRKR